MGRYGISCELNSEYYADSLDYLNDAEMELESPTLFDFMDNPD
jgi:hypothetical protein